MLFILSGVLSAVRASLRSSKEPSLVEGLKRLRAMAIYGPWQPALLSIARRFIRNAPLKPTERPQLAGPSADQLAFTLKQNGWVGGVTADPDLVQRICTFLEANPKQTYHDPHLQCEEIQELAHDRTALDVARRYFGAEPIFNRSDLWSSQSIHCADVSRSHLYRFHFDVADVKSLIMFVYLTDVGLENGPHVLIPGTHHPKSILETARVYLPDAEAEKRYGDRIHTITGPRGTVFFEEQTIYHKQLRPSGPRTVLALTYTLWRKPRSASQSSIAQRQYA